ncbi:MAG: acetyl-CoA carboxylase biotin carboxylase subunit, partial [Gammaproteobacteria bacterium]|nr:acetyl-CoA carboxylase biotin carboxylase subunit [Gammaproteobacteria bacterium]
MFKKILIANRGEIACRAIRTASRLGVATVAVYADVDRDALHVRMADEAVQIGTAPSADSYLRGDRILAACRQTGAEAVYPGYGFLSENAEFARQLAAAGIVFIGPDARAIEAMGDKITSKQLAEKAGVNVIPGFPQAIADAEHAVGVAREIGYPVMLKASAGGGGKGMRIAHDDDQCREGFTRAANEARNSFGDDRLLVEKFIEQPRHIEIQIIADNSGNTVYLHERECSIQRRHQKVIEEAPSPFLDAATRAAMGEQAVALARAVDYRSAGTVEFIVDAQHNFYFLEMNTRLQVEHPVTELITGLDLIELMLRVADGETLPIRQSDITIDGWAMETRIYAENPLRDFLPSVGRLLRYREPPASRTVRVDAGVVEGGEISIYYDPMIAKLITWGATRGEAIDAMRAALDAYYIRGVETNIAFLAALMNHPRFVAGDISTSFISEEYANGFTAEHMVPADANLLFAIAVAVHQRMLEKQAGISGQLPGRTANLCRDWVVVNHGHETAVSIDGGSDSFDVDIDDTRYRVRSTWRTGEPLFTGTVNGRSVCVQIERKGIGYRLAHDGVNIEALVLNQRAAVLNR